MRNKSLAKAVLCLTLIAAPSAPALAQNANNSHKEASTTTQEIFAGSGKEKYLSRFTAAVEKPGYRLFGRADIFGGRPEYFSKMHVTKKLGALEGVMEVEKMSGGQPEFKFGAGLDFKPAESVHTDVHVMPLVFTSKGYQKEIEIEAFTAASLGRKYYLENLTNLGVPYNGRPEFRTEFVAGKWLNDRIAVEGRAAYNLNVRGWSGGAGLRYRIR